MSQPGMPAEQIHVVVVDDDELVRATMVDWLESAGFLISAASGFESGLALFRQPRPVHALVTDYNLAPAVTGVQLALEARKLQPALPVVLITGNPNALAEDHAVPGAVVMTKAMGFSSLAARLHSAIDKTRSGSL